VYYDEAHTIRCKTTPAWRETLICICFRTLALPKILFARRLIVVYTRNNKVEAKGWCAERKVCRPGT